MTGRNLWILITIFAIEAHAEPITLVLGGDVMLGRVSRGGHALIGGDAPLAGVADVLRGADLAVVNLETALCEVAPRWAGRPLLTAPPERAAVLAEAGVDVAGIANNHALDGGAGGVSSTIAALEAAGVTVVGEADTAAGIVLEVGGARIGLLAATDRWSATLPSPLPIAFVPTREMERTLVGRVRALRRRSDAVVVSLHWGPEGTATPSGQQRALARALADAGAAVIAGHHAHVLQPVEGAGSAVVLYGMGNLVSDMRGPRRSALFRVRLDRVDGQLVATEVTELPVVVAGDGAPRLDGEERRVWSRAPAAEADQSPGSSM